MLLLKCYLKVVCFSLVYKYDNGCLHFLHKICSNFIENWNG